MGNPTQTVIELESRSSIELDFDTVFELGQFSLFPHVEERGLAFVSIRRGRVIISAGAFVGLVPLTGRLSLEIVPKVPVKNLSRVFEVARGVLGSLRSVSRTYSVDKQAGNGVLHFIVENLLDAIRVIEMQGYEKTYSLERARSSQLRGRLRVRETMAQCWSRGLLHQAVTERYNQTADTIRNRVIKAAVRYVLDLIPTEQDAGRHLLAAAARTYSRMPTEIAALSNLEVSRLPSSLPDASQATQAYQRALDIALMLLVRKGISLERTGTDIALASYILNMEEMFEDYLRNCLRSLVPVECLVGDGNGDARRPLYRQKPLGPFAQPDIVVTHRSRPPVIVEVKYKTKVDRADINQAVTYAVAYGTLRVVILHVAVSSQKTGPYLIGRVGDIDVDGFAFDLGAEALDVQERALSDYLSNVPQLLS